MIDDVCGTVVLEGESARYVANRKPCTIMADVISAEFPEGGPIRYRLDEEGLKLVYARPRRGR